MGRYQPRRALAASGGPRTLGPKYGRHHPRGRAGHAPSPAHPTATRVSCRCVTARRSSTSSIGYWRRVWTGRSSRSDSTTKTLQRLSSAGTYAVCRSFMCTIERLESGGAIRHAVTRAGVEGRFVVLNGDVLVEFDFARALNMHTEPVRSSHSRSTRSRPFAVRRCGRRPSRQHGHGLRRKAGRVARRPPPRERRRLDLRTRIGGRDSDWSGTCGGDALPTLVEKHRRVLGLSVRRSLGRHWHERTLPRRNTALLAGR